MNNIVYSCGVIGVDILYLVTGITFGYMLRDIVDRFLHTHERKT
jgi:uncharacterized membrane protein